MYDPAQSSDVSDEIENVPKYKIGLDVHGILDSNPIWKEIATMFMNKGYEVHIITGSLMPKAFKELKKLGMERHSHYTHIFSISDSLIMKGCAIRYNADNSPEFDDLEWDKEKALYCERKGISMHFDDTQRYAKYFTTPICIRN